MVFCIYDIQFLESRVLFPCCAYIFKRVMFCCVYPFDDFQSSCPCSILIIKATHLCVPAIIMLYLVFVGNTHCCAALLFTCSSPSQLRTTWGSPIWPRPHLRLSFCNFDIYQRAHVARLSTATSDSWTLRFRCFRDLILLSLQRPPLAPIAALRNHPRRGLVTFDLIAKD